MTDAFKNRVSKDPLTRWLPVSELYVDTSYQRNIDANRVRRIVERWDEKLVNPIKVSFRDGRYWVFDGQHTLTAWKIKHPESDSTIKCMIFYGLTKHDEILLFVAQNGISAPVKPIDKFRALYEDGDFDTMEMVKAVRQAGLVIDFKNYTAKNRVVAVKALTDAYKMLGSYGLFMMLDCIKKAWDGDEKSLSCDMLDGMSLFFKTYVGKCNFNRLSERLSAIPPANIIRDGKMLTSSCGRKRGIARTILNIYNKRAGKGRLEDLL